uniref:BTB domain-containing protein n=1 Tax=Erpetoichthys calabaricus TaxID=27687 RepID=A0A8C4SHY7_ERPCA
MKCLNTCDTHYQKTLLKSLNKQRLLGLFCDVTFIVQDHTYRAHKNILAAATSSFFHQLFKETGPAVKETHIPAPSVTHSILTRPNVQGILPSYSNNC